MSSDNLKSIIEAALFAAGEPLTTERLQQLFDTKPSAKDIHAAIETLIAEYQMRPLELVEVASGYRFQVRSEYANWLQRLWEKRPPRYSRALLETLALVAYRQPITRGEIEDVRGVAISTNIMKILQDREWVKVVGYKDVPGKPALYGTTKKFLDYFNLKALGELPSLQEIMSMEEVEQKLQQQFALDVEGGSQLGEMEEALESELAQDQLIEEAVMVDLELEDLSSEEELEFEEELDSEVDDKDHV